MLLPDQVKLTVKRHLHSPVSPFLKNLSTLPTNMQSIPMTSGPQTRSVPLWFFFTSSSLMLAFDEWHFPICSRSRWKKCISASDFLYLKCTLLLYMTCDYLVLQVSAGWKHGDSVDEHAKTHPLLKPYKALSEKVHARTHMLLLQVEAVFIFLMQRIYREAFQVHESCIYWRTCFSSRGRNNDVDCINRQSQSATRWQNKKETGQK